jgi:nitrite reductase (NADH) large subunit
VSSFSFDAGGTNNDVRAAHNDKGVLLGFPRARTPFFLGEGMSALLEPIFVPHALADPIVIVGAGPVGVCLANELNRRDPERTIVVYGAERWSPYNRVRLSSALAGETAWVDLMADTRLPESPMVEARLGCPVVTIERIGQCIVDAQRRVQPYSFLVLATGSSPHMPNLPGIDLPGVFAFRDMDNALQLAARRARTHRTVVLGGGLLGIEAARAMQRSNTEVFIVEHSDRLMPRQLDAAASDQLKHYADSAGIQVVLGDGPVRIYGDTRVQGVQLRSGQVIPCDTVVVAAGIRPNIELALRAKLHVGRGIRVNDQMCTSDPHILAVGECAEHRGQVYGLVGPGLEQAGVAAHVLAGGTADYSGSAAATRLKVLRYPVFSMGDVGADQLPDFSRAYVYASPSERIYRKIVVRRGRLIGALALGQWDAIPRVQEAVTKGRRVWPWQALHFRHAGDLWPAKSSEQVGDWPANTVICNCTGVTRGRLSEAIMGGCASVAEISACTGASTVCGSCRPLVTQLLGSQEPREPVKWAGKLFGFAAVAAVLALAFFLLPGVPYPDRVNVPLRWDFLWRNGIAKQASGYTLLALAVGLAVLGLRKRIERFAWGDYGIWRFIHTVIGLGVLLGFVVHTGGRMGTQLNLLLAVSFVGAALAGGVFAGLVAREHVIDAVRARKLKAAALWAHILFVWPLPVLLAFHIAQGYLF